MNDLILFIQIKEILQEEEDLSEIVQLVGKVIYFLEIKLNYFIPQKNFAYSCTDFEMLF